MDLKLSYNRYISGVQAFNKGVIEAVPLVTINDEELDQEKKKILESGEITRQKEETMANK